MALFQTICSIVMDLPIQPPCVSSPYPSRAIASSDAVRHNATAINGGASCATNLKGRSMRHPMAVGIPGRAQGTNYLNV